jgi:hypothetical protein
VIPDLPMPWITFSYIAMDCKSARCCLKMSKQLFYSREESMARKAHSFGMTKSF